MDEENELIEEKKTRELDLQHAISNQLNVYGFDIKEFIRIEACDHRTLQQKFTGLALAWIDYVGSDEYTFDGRNEASHKVCGKIKNFMDENDIYIGMPLI